MQFAGANNPLYIIRNGELNIYKGDRMPIGIHMNFDKPFTNYDISLHGGDMIYLFSDGYADQFGGPDGGKLKYKEFRELILKHHKLPMVMQKQALDKEFNDWRGDLSQIDDVIVVGLKM